MIKAAKISRCLEIVRWHGLGAAVCTSRPLLILGIGNGREGMELFRSPLGETIVCDGYQQRFSVRIPDFYPGLFLPSWVVMSKLCNYPVSSSLKWQ